MLAFKPERFPTEWHGLKQCLTGKLISRRALAPGFSAVYEPDANAYRLMGAEPRAMRTRTVTCDPSSLEIQPQKRQRADRTRPLPHLAAMNIMSTDYQPPGTPHVVSCRVQIGYR